MIVFESSKTKKEDFMKVKGLSFVLIFMLALTSQAAVYDGSRSEYKKANGVVDKILKYPSWFMMVPTSKYSKLSTTETSSQSLIFNYVHKASHNKSITGSDIGLRLFFQKDTSRSNRKQLTRNLKASGLLRDGDIMLTFHPDWGGAGAYTSLMSGISHSGIAYEDGTGAVANLDMPLDNQTAFESNGRLSHLSNDHYMNYTSFIHIIRPKFSREQIQRVKAWARKIIENRTKFYKKTLFFSGDYMSPSYMLHPQNFQKLLSQRAPLETSIQAYDLANMALGRGLKSSGYVNVAKTMSSRSGRVITQKALKLFCSDFVRSLHALRNCSVDNMSDDCVKDPYKAMKLLGEEYRGIYEPGLADVNTFVMKALKITDKSVRDKMIDEIFTAKKSFSQIKISGGHRKASKAIDRAVYEGVRQYLKAYADYMVTESVSSHQAVMAYRQKLNQPVNLQNSAESGMPANYSPTTFLIEALSDNSNYEYVATVALSSKSQYNQLVSAIDSPDSVRSVTPRQSFNEPTGDLGALKNQILNLPNSRALAVRCVGGRHYSKVNEPLRRWAECKPFTDYESLGGDTEATFSPLYR